MTEEEIIKGTVLIAEFMGYHMKHTKFQTQEFHSSNESHWVWDEGEIVVDINGHEVSDSDNEPYCSLEHLPFRSSWGWLMETIIKIERECNHDVHIYAHHNWTAPNRCSIIDWRNNVIVETSNDSKIKGVFEAVVNFIKWYNNAEN